MNALFLLYTRHPQHVFLIKDNAHADQLLLSNRLADETVLPKILIKKRAKKTELDELPLMKLNLVRRATGNKSRVSAARPADIVQENSIIDEPQAPDTLIIDKNTHRFRLVWESAGLAERDLSIPKGANTHPTGSMGLKKGVFEGINFRHYFREEVFSDLIWTPDPSPSKWERAIALFYLVIKGMDYGSFSLKISHKTDTNSRSYKQSNFMTQLHWGEAKKHIAKPELLGRSLRLFRKETVPPEFLIEID